MLINSTFQNIFINLKILTCLFYNDTLISIIELKVNEEKSKIGS